jgi:hypothetical protein
MKMDIYKEVVKSWNDDADGYNQWPELDEQEKVEYAYLCGTRWAGSNFVPTELSTKTGI